MSQPEYLRYRCCMCPQIGTAKATCPKGTPCRFVRSYRDDQGRVLFVTAGLTRGTAWFTGYRQPNGTIRRLVSPALPLRQTHDEAQADLNMWAQKKGLPEAEVAS